METELKFQLFPYMDLLAKVVTTHEESLETVLPDYCASVSRILDATGQLFVREKHPAEGTLQGSVRVTVLYLSEEAEGLQSFRVMIPFSCRFSEPQLRACSAMQVAHRLLLCEAKPVTARKLFLRVIPELTVYGYGGKTARLCVGAEGEGLQLRQEKQTLSLLAAVEERAGMQTWEFAAEGGCAAEEVLLDACLAQVHSCQPIGSKLVVKGELAVSALVRTAGGKPERICQSVPVSQILDGIQLPPESKLLVLPAVSSWDLRLMRGEGGCSFGLTAQLSFQVFAYRAQEICVVADLYSTCLPVTAQRETVTVTQRYLPVRCETAVEERLEFGQGEAFAYLTAFDGGTPTVRAEGGCCRVCTATRMRFLYQDEAGSPMLAERSRESETQVDGCPGLVWLEHGNAELRSLSGGCSVRVPLAVFAAPEEQTALCTVSSVEEGDTEEGQRPSLVLCRPAAGETLWSLAKCHGSTEDAIRRANRLEADTLPDGLLLIPCARRRTGG